MSIAGTYLYGFTERTFEPPADLRGLRDAPVRLIGFEDIAALVSDHPVQRLNPSRSNLEPHHRVVRRVSHEATLVPAAFGHVSDTAAGIASVLRLNHHDIRRELDRLADKSEMTLKIRWNVDNIFNHLVRTDRALRDARDRIFRGREPSMNDKLQLGSLFEATLNRERERMSTLALGAFEAVAGDVARTPPRDEKTICHAALLVPRSRMDAFDLALRHVATLFDASVALEYSGPWPPYSFVNLRLRPSETPAAA